MSKKADLHAGLPFFGGER
ncbi:Protein of unknown function [Bacillus cereus]|nr:Protein of unknown function [Bacillus cereus]